MGRNGGGHCEAEMQEQRRVIEWMAEMLAELSEPTMGAQTAEEWIRTAEQEVACDDELNKAMDYSYLPEE